MQCQEVSIGVASAQQKYAITARCSILSRATLCEARLCSSDRPRIQHQLLGLMFDISESGIVSDIRNSGTVSDQELRNNVRSGTSRIIFDHQVSSIFLQCPLLIITIANTNHDQQFSVKQTNPRQQQLFKVLDKVKL